MGENVTPSDTIVGVGNTDTVIELVGDRDKERVLLPHTDAVGEREPDGVCDERTDMTVRVEQNVGERVGLREIV